MESYWSLVVGVIMLTLVSGCTGWASFRGALRPNWGVGIRIPSTQASDRAWYAGHRAAAPLLTVGAVFGAVMTMVSVIYGVVAGQVSDTVPWVGFGGVVVAVLLATVPAHRAAKAVQ